MNARPALSDRLAAGLSLAVFVVLALAYGFRPDALAALTIWPPWAWAPLGALPLLLVVRRLPRPTLCGLLTLWVVFVLAATDELGPALRPGPWPAPDWAQARKSGDGVRVITLNCAGGRLAAAREPAAYEPDIVLLQECPPKAECEKLAREWWGDGASVAWSPDNAILARWRQLQEPKTGPGYVYAVIHTPLSSSAIISTRLQPPELQLELWRPAVWASQTRLRRERREQLRGVVDALAEVPTATAVIVGGDFNAPAGDAIFRLLQPRLHDVWPRYGLGWGDTVLNDTPIARFDQIWVSDGWQVLAAVVRRTEHSDHRMVIADLRAPANP